MHLFTIVKDNDTTVRLASSAENANATTPVAIGITGVGIGTYPYNYI